MGIITILKRDFINKSFADHKRRMDRGGTYWGYVGMIMSGATLLGVYKIHTWWMFASCALAIVLFRYIAGYGDEKRVLASEQDSYNQNNPFVVSVMSDLDYIKKQVSKL